MGKNTMETAFKKSLSSPKTALKSRFQILKVAVIQ
jgi:hypothetical protein